VSPGCVPGEGSLTPAAAADTWATLEHADVLSNKALSSCTLHHTGSNADVSAANGVLGADQATPVKRSM
jgi:hypothetical protein